MTNIIISGVGGQGTLLAGKILSTLALLSGQDVKMSEIHGMAQRGGAVITHVRIGWEILAPLVPLNEADFVVAFEQLEALRARDFLSPEGLMIYNRQRILPLPVILGAAQYPQAPQASHILALDALEMARQAGNTRAVNVVLLGALSLHLPFDQSLWEEALRRTVKPNTLGINLKAFEIGRNFAINEKQNHA